MGLTALLGVFVAGALSDRLGPAWPTAASFVARILAGLLMVDQSAVSAAIFALVFGATFLVTAPLTVLFVSETFGLRHLGSLTGLITLVHHMSGAIGAYLGVRHLRLQRQLRCRVPDYARFVCARSCSDMAVDEIIPGLAREIVNAVGAIGTSPGRYTQTTRRLAARSWTLLIRVAPL